MNNKQAQYEVYIDHEKIGTSYLEYGDPPMGFAHGKFFPTQQYRSLKKEESYKVYIEGELIPCEHCVISEFSEGRNDVYIELTICVSDWRTYEKFFSHHIETYTKNLSS